MPAVNSRVDIWSVKLIPHPMTPIASAAVCMNGFIVANILLFVSGPNVNGCFVLCLCLMPVFVHLVLPRVAIV